MESGSSLPKHASTHRASKLADSKAYFYEENTESPFVTDSFLLYKCSSSCNADSYQYKNYSDKHFIISYLASNDHTHDRSSVRSIQRRLLHHRWVFHPAAPDS